MNSMQLSNNKTLTINYYNENAELFFQNTAFLNVSDTYSRFEKFLPHKAKVLDAGCGSGRDSLHFMKMGYEVTAFDASKEMVSRAKELTGLNVSEFTFMDMDFENNYDGIWACASLLHIPKSEIDIILEKFITALLDGGVLYASFKFGDCEVFRNGRLFVDYNTESFSQLIQHHPELDIIDQWITEDVRPDRNEKWLNCILRKVTCPPSRSVEAGRA